jgi:hypothetical protein
MMRKMMQPAPSDKAGGSASRGDPLAVLPELSRALRVARTRTTANRFLRNWMIWLNWTLGGLLVAALWVARLKAILVATTIVLVLGAIVTVARIWWSKPSLYALACELDSAAGLYDRASTALHLASVEKPNVMIQRQRRDALERLVQVDARSLFPIRLPAFARRTLGLVLLVAGLFMYRAYQQPPVGALLHSVANSRLAKAVLAPLAKSVKRDVLALMKQDNAADTKQISADAEVVPGLAESRNSGALSQPGNEARGTPDRDWQPDSAPTDQPVGEPGNLQPGETAQQPEENKSESNQLAAKTDQPSQTAQSTDRGPGEQQASNSPQPGSGAQSGAKSVMQALKNLMKSIRGQDQGQSPPPAEWAPGDKAPTAQASAQAGNSHEHSAQGDTSKGDSDRRDTSAISDPKKPGGGAGNGSTPIPHQGAKNTPALAGTLPRDRVDLDATDFRQVGHLRTSAGPGTAFLPLRNAQPQPVAAVKGAEQENIPGRYRLYVQRYFERADKGSR